MAWHVERLVLGNLRWLTLHKAGLGLGGLQRSRPLEQGGISCFLLEGLPMCAACLMLARFYVGKFLHFCAFLVPVIAFGQRNIVYFMHYLF